MQKGMMSSRNDLARLRTLGFDFKCARFGEVVLIDSDVGALAA